MLTTLILCQTHSWGFPFSLAQSQLLLPPHRGGGTSVADVLRLSARLSHGQAGLSPWNSNEMGEGRRQLQRKMKGAGVCFVSRRKDRARHDSTLPIHKYHMKAAVNNYLPHPSEAAGEESSLICCRRSGWVLGITFTQAHETLAEGLQEATAPPIPRSSSEGCPRRSPQAWDPT